MSSDPLAQIHVAVIKAAEDGASPEEIAMSLAQIATDLVVVSHVADFDQWVLTVGSMWVRSDWNHQARVAACGQQGDA